MKLGETWAIGAMFQNGRRMAFSPENSPHSALWGIVRRTALLSLSWALDPLSNSVWEGFFVEIGEKLAR